MSADLEGILRAVESEFDLEPGSVSSATRVVDDLGFDSLEILRLGLLLEELMSMVVLPVLLDLRGVELGRLLETVTGESLNRFT